MLNKAKKVPGTHASREGKLLFEKYLGLDWKEIG